MVSALSSPGQIDVAIEETAWKEIEDTDSSVESRRDLWIVVMILTIVGVTSARTFGVMLGNCPENNSRAPRCACTNAQT